MAWRRSPPRRQDSRLKSTSHLRHPKGKCPSTEPNQLGSIASARKICCKEPLLDHAPGPRRPREPRRVEQSIKVGRRFAKQAVRRCEVRARKELLTKVVWKVLPVSARTLAAAMYQSHTCNVGTGYGIVTRATGTWAQSSNYCRAGNNESRELHTRWEMGGGRGCALAGSSRSESPNKLLPQGTRRYGLARL